MSKYGVNRCAMRWRKTCFKYSKCFKHSKIKDNSYICSWSFYTNYWLWKTTYKNNSLFDKYILCSIVYYEPKRSNSHEIINCMFCVMSWATYVHFVTCRILWKNLKTKYWYTIYLLFCHYLSRFEWLSQGFITIALSRLYSG